jgi:uncharacterized membrane protein
MDIKLYCFTEINGNIKSFKEMFKTFNHCLMYTCMCLSHSVWAGRGGGGAGGGGGGGIRLPTYDHFLSWKS